jgi:hypothetical protein
MQKKNLNELFAHVCAYWSLFNLQEISYDDNGNIIYKKLHAT